MFDFITTVSKYKSMGWKKGRKQTKEHIKRSSEANWKPIEVYDGVKKQRRWFKNAKVAAERCGCTPTWMYYVLRMYDGNVRPKKEYVRKKPVFISARYAKRKKRYTK